MLWLKVNGESQTVSTAPERPLLWVLRDILGLKGTKYGCGIGACGICIVHVDGEPVRACVTPVADVAGRVVTTIEGLAPDHPVMKAWIAEQVPQCGYCQPGQIMAAASLLERNRAPDDTAIDRVMSGVLCRCGTYPRIRRAIHRAARAQGDDASRDALVGAPVGTVQEPTATSSKSRPTEDAFAPNPWVRIHRDGTVTVLIDRSEMGQGVVTGLAMLVAEELEVDLNQVRTVFAPAAAAYANPIIGEQLTGGSTSVRGAWEVLRRAGAVTREALIGAAAVIWGASSQACRAEQGTVVHLPSGRRLGYGALVDKARSLPVPEDVPLKGPADFKLIGRSVPRLELPAMVQGRTVYGMDVTLPGMLVTSVERCPIIGGKVATFDAARARQVEGVRTVVEIPSGLAVVADSFWAALKGREALEVTWDPGSNSALSSASIRQRFERAAERKGKAVRKEGNTVRALKGATQAFEAVYDTPHLAHGCMEPMNCTARVMKEGCEIWTGTQAQTDAQQAVARITGLAQQRVKVNTQFLGGGFGRRLQSDFVREAVQVAKGLKDPIQVVWTRQDDMRHDFFRPANYTLLKAGLNDQGMPVAWFQRVVGPPLALDGVQVPYAIPNIRVEFVTEDPGVPTGPWRSVGASQNAFVIEGFIDELAFAAGRDPFEYRRSLLAHAPHYQKVLALAADRAGWYESLPPDRYRGIAFYYSFESAVAQVAEVAVSPEGAIRVHRVVCAVDCGIAVNPDSVVAQMEGGIVFGLSAALKGEITIEDGRVQQTTFEDYPILTLAETPTMEVYIVPSTDPPGGVGEPGVPLIAPAVANAVFAATGQRLRSMPLRLR